MYIRLNQKVRNLIVKSIRKAGSERKLEKVTGIDHRIIHKYKTLNKSAVLENIIKIGEFYGLEESDIMLLSKILPDNWRQIVGGKKSYETKVKNGSFNKNLEKMIKNSSKILSKWHRDMRKQSMKKYYISQYERFKKIREYKYITKNKEKVRNKLEKDVADFLFQNGINYRYEPYIRCRHIYFPDFVLDNKIILECTMWHGFDKATKLYKKIKDFEKNGFRIFVIVTPNVKKFYRKINKYIVDDLRMLYNNLRISHCSSDQSLKIGRNW